MDTVTVHTPVRSSLIMTASSGRDRIHDLDSFQDHMKNLETPDAMLSEWSLI